MCIKSVFPVEDSNRMRYEHLLGSFMDVHEIVEKDPRCKPRIFFVFIYFVNFPLFWMFLLQINHEKWYDYTYKLNRFQLIKGDYNIEG